MAGGGGVGSCVGQGAVEGVNIRCSWGGVGVALGWRCSVYGQCGGVVGKGAGLRRVGGCLGTAQAWGSE